MKNLFVTLLMLVPASLMAQDDDLYFVPEKPVAKVIKETSANKYSVDNKNKSEIVDYHSSSRNEDEYNRMYDFGSLCFTIAGIPSHLAL